MKKIVTVVMPLFVVLLGLFLFYQSPNVQEDDTEEEGSSWLSLSDEQIAQGEIKLAPAQQQALSILLPISGKIAVCPDRHAHISTRSKAIVKRAYKNIGDLVEENELLAVIESKELAEAKANYLSASSKRILKKDLLEKENTLAARNLGALQELMQMEADFQLAEIERNFAEQQLYLFGLQSQEIEQLKQVSNASLPLFEVKAPFEGTLLNRDITIGEVLPEGIEIYEIANLDQLRVEFAVSPRDASCLKSQQKITFIDAWHNMGEAFLERISPIIDEQNGMVSVIALLDNTDKKWRPGTAITGNLLLEEITRETCVPIDAVVTIEETPYVFIAHGNQFELREITFGESDEHFISISSGIDSGEEIVIENATLLKCELTKQEPD